MSAEELQTIAHLSATHWVDYVAFLVPVLTVLATVLIAIRLERDEDDSGPETEE